MLNVRDNLTGDVLIKLLMADSFVPRMHFAVQPAFRIDAVDGENFDFSRTYIRLDDIQQKKSLVFEVVGSRCRYQEQCKTEVPIDANFHVFIERWAVPGVELPLHKLVFLSLNIM